GQDKGLVAWHLERLRHRKEPTMLRKISWTLAVVLAAAGTAAAAEGGYGLKKGTPDLKSAGPLAFGPDGVLFVGDPQGGAIFAIDTGDKSSGGGAIKVEKIDEKVASLLGTDAKGIQINAIAVNPASG